MQLWADTPPLGCSKNMIVHVSLHAFITLSKHIISHSDDTGWYYDEYDSLSWFMRYGWYIRRTTEILLANTGQHNFILNFIP